MPLAGRTGEVCWPDAYLAFDVTFGASALAVTAIAGAAAGAYYGGSGGGGFGEYVGDIIYQRVNR